MRILKTLLPLFVLLLWSTSVKADYDPTRPPEPGVFFTLTTRCVPEEAGRNLTPTNAYPFGSSVSMHVEANDHFRFMHWEDEEGNEVSASMDFVYTMPSNDVTLTALFKYDPTLPEDPSTPEFKWTYIDFRIMPEGAGYMSVGEPGEYESGTIQYFTARAYENFRFVNWTIDGIEVGIEPTIEYTVPKENHTLTANFKYYPEFPEEPGTPHSMRKLVLKSNPEGGAAYLNGAGEYPEGTEQRINLQANPYYTFVNWTDDLGEEVSDVADFLYTVPSRNAVLTANFTFGYHPDLPSEPGNPDISDIVPENMVSWPRIGMYDDTHVQILCETPGATIHYTLDGSIPNAESPVYTEPVFVGSNLLVKAIAYKEGMEDSPVVSYQVTVYKAAAPVFTLENRKIKIISETPGAIIRYTLDFSNPTEESPVYTAPFEPEENCRIKAYAGKEGLTDSPVSYYVYRRIDHVLAPPTFSFDDEGRLVITPAVSGGKTYYTTDGSDPTEESLIYSVPLELHGNCIVKAYTTHINYLDSPIAEFVISDGDCAGVRVSYNGRYLRLETDEVDAIIRYTEDGTDPSLGIEYEGEFDVEGLGLIRAVVTKPGCNDSEVTDYVIEYYADEEHAETSAEGLLASALEWNGSTLPEGTESFRIVGLLNDSDYEFIQSMDALHHLDLEKVADAQIPENAFINSRLISISLPEDLRECGDNILSGAANLSSVVWNSRTMNVEDGLTRGLVNPNVLLYVPSEVSVTHPYGLNIIKEGVESAVTLHYGYPYYAARDFKAARVSLTHEFTQITGVEGCSGWETLVLPFSPTSMTHEVNGPVVPFAAWDSNVDGDRPFWLYSAISTGWKKAEKIEACVPYVISMPNNVYYYETFNLRGRVTFSAEDVDLGPDSSIAYSSPWMDGTRFEGSFMPVEDAGILSLNVNSTEGEFQPGSTFVADVTTVPFGAYVSGASGRRSMPLFGDLDSVEVLPTSDAGLLIETPAPGVLRICSGRECKVAVITATGVTLRTLHLMPGESRTLEGLTRDLYIVAGRKVMVR